MKLLGRCSVLKTACLLVLCVVVGVALPPGGEQNAFLAATAAMFRKKERLPTQNYSIDDWGTAHVAGLPQPRR